MTRYLFGTDIPDPTDPDRQIQDPGNDNDGVALFAARHPRPSFWRRVGFWLHPPRLHDSALETIEIDLPENE